MKDKDLDLNKSGSLPESSEHMQGEGASKADMKRGFQRVNGDERDDGFLSSGEGFLPRAHGWDR